MEQKIERTFVKQEVKKNRKNNNKKNKMYGRRTGCQTKFPFMFGERNETMRQ